MTRGVLSFRASRLGTVVATGAVALSAMAATAQVYESRDGAITIDWSVLEGTTGRQYVTHVAPMAPFFNGGGGLRIPGATPPISKLHVSTPRVAPATDATANISSPKVPTESMASNFTPPANGAPPPATVEVSEPKSERKSIAEATPKPTSAIMAMETPPPPPAMPKAPVVEEVAPTVSKAPETPTEPKKTEADRESETASSAMEKPVVETPPEKTPPPSASDSKVVAETASPPPPALTPPNASLRLPKKPEPRARENAALPNVGNMGAGGALKVVFAATSAKVPEAQKASLDMIADNLARNESFRVQLLAYAGGPTLSSSKARRMSLSRALSVRTYLMDKGINSTRIHVRALGDKTTDEPINRVEVMITERN